MTPFHQTLRCAADSLREEANLHRESCQINGRDWQCQDCPGTPDKCPARKRYEELTELADKLTA